MSAPIDSCTGDMTDYKETGFTIIELLIVIAIIYILASIALPATHISYAAKHTVISSISSVKPLQLDIVNYYNQHQRFPNDSNELNAECLSALTIDNVTDINILAEGRIIITYASHLNFSFPNHYSFDLSDRTLILTPAFSDDIISWDFCSEGTVPADFRPSACYDKS